MKKNGTPIVHQISLAGHGCSVERRKGLSGAVSAACNAFFLRRGISTQLTAQYGRGLPLRPRNKNR